MYLVIDKTDGFIKESNGNKYSVFSSTGKNKKVLTKKKEVWDGVKNEIKAINSGKKFK